MSRIYQLSQIGSVGCYFRTKHIILGMRNEEKT